MTKNDEGYSFRKMSYPYIKKNLKFLEEDENMNMNNGNLNENISYNSNEKDEENNINIKNENFEEKKEIILENQLLIPEIMNIYQKAKKFDYNFELININFKDFIHKFSFENKENKNTTNIINNNLENNIEKQKIINESFSYLSPTINNSIENVNNNNYLGKYIILENGKKQINKDSINCNCKNSSCLKFYCECFSNGKYCENCLCCNCKNIPQYENLRQEKYKNILSRNPKAIYQINSTKKSWICNCKNSNCIKNYCDCFQNGKSCTSKCRCVNCLNKIQNNNNNNNGKGKGKGKTRRIRGGKKLLKNNIFLTPKKRSNENQNNEYSKNIKYNQSTAEYTENNNNKINNFSNSKCKAISLKLNMSNV